MTKYYMGVDPGLSGAIAFYNPDNMNTSKVSNLPIFVINGKKRLDIAATLNLLAPMVKDVIHCVLEEPHAMPKQGVTSCFNFGRVCGQLQGLVAGLQIPYTLVAPQVWKRSLGLGSDKDMVRKLASERFPTLSHHWPLKKDHDKAEAMLLAYHCYTLNNCESNKRYHFNKNNYNTSFC